MNYPGCSGSLGKDMHISAWFLTLVNMAEAKRDLCGTPTHSVAQHRLPGVVLTASPCSALG